MYMYTLYQGIFPSLSTKSLISMLKIYSSQDASMYMIVYTTLYMYMHVQGMGSLTSNIHVAGKVITCAHTCTIKLQNTHT